MVDFRVFGAPRFFSPEVPKILILKGFVASGRKIGRAPQERENQPRRIQPPILGPLRYFFMTELVLKCFPSYVLSCVAAKNAMWTSVYIT